MIKIAIVEDNPEDRNTVLNCLKKYQNDNGISFSVETYSNGFAFFEHLQHDENILLLDVEMPQMNGLQIARKIRQHDKDVTIIFITQMAKYAINGYEVDAMDFILKPVDYFNFSLKMDKALLIQEKRKNSALLVDTMEGKEKILTESILFCESQAHYVLIHTDSGISKTRSSMKEFAKQLDSSLFCRCNNSFLINLARVEKVSGSDVVIGGKPIPISRSHRKDFLDSLSMYYGNLR